MGEPTILGRTWLSFPAGYGLSSGHASTERGGIEVKALHVRRMTHKCGSCPTAGRLTFNAELLFQAARGPPKSPRTPTSATESGAPWGGAPGTAPGLPQ